MSQREMPVRKPAIASPYHIVLKCLSNEPGSRIRGQTAEGLRRPSPRNPCGGRIALPAAPHRAGRKIRSQPRHPSCPPSPRRLACAPEKRAGANHWLQSGSTRLVPMGSVRRRRSRCRSHCQSGGRSRAITPPRHQRYRRGPAHQSRPRAALTRRRSRKSMPSPLATRISSTT